MVSETWRIEKSLVANKKRVDRSPVAMRENDSLSRRRSFVFVDKRGRSVSALLSLFYNNIITAFLEIVCSAGHDRVADAIDSRGNGGLTLNTAGCGGSGDICYITLRSFTH